MTEAEHGARRMHLAAFVCAGPVSGHHGGWRFSTADRDMLSAGYYAGLGRILEAGRFDLLFLADILAVPSRYEGRMDSQLRHGALGALRLDPLLVLAAIAGTTSRLGLASTVSTSYFHPFDVARSLATLDHLSGGRAAWNIVTSFQDAEAENFGLVEQLSRDERYDRADEFVEVACKLWDSWADDALKRDPGPPLFADPARVREINHDGRWFKVRGPLNVSRPPQGRPVFIQAGASSRGRDFAARWAEIIFVTYGSLEQGIAFYRDMKKRAAELGRDPDQIKILPGMVPVIGRSREEADDKSRILDDLADPEAGLSTLSYHLDIDLAPFPKNEILPELDPKGVRGHYAEVAELTRKNGLSLSALGKRYGTGPLRDFIGAGHEVADKMAEWFEAGACDGFMVQVPYVPGGVEDFVDGVVPELQRRGLFRREYEGTTLRDHLGLGRPCA
jgi:FMN-dependent oxidoreductase (nitrilotriacetate monooxygenase family)